MAWPGRRAKRGEAGAAAVEFALVLPVLLLVIFGIIDFGRMLHAKITLAQAAREGARATALVDESTGRSQVTKATTGIDTSGGALAVEVTPCATPPDPDTDATVTLTYQFSLVTPLSLLAGLGDGDGQIELQSTSVMPCLG